MAPEVRRHHEGVQLRQESVAQVQRLDGRRHHARAEGHGVLVNAVVSVVVPFSHIRS